MDILRQVPLFADLEENELSDLSTRFELVRFARNDLIFRQGQGETRLYVIKKGFVKIYKMDTEGAVEKTLAVIREGDYFGEMALISDRSRTAFAKAMVDIETLVLSKTSFDEFLQSFPTASLKIFSKFCDALIERLDSTNKLLLENLRADSSKTKSPFDLETLISQRKAISLTTMSNVTLTGIPLRYGDNVGEAELLLESQGYLFLIPYHAISHFKIKV